MAHHSQGYTLLEMLVVIAIVAVMSTIALSTVKTDQTPRSASEWAEVIEGDLFSARSEAVKSGRPVWLSFDTKENVLKGEHPATIATTLPTDIKLKAHTGKFPDAAHGVAMIVFLPSGASSGGTISLADKSGTVSIEVNWLTGSISMRKQAAP